jgi:hypothetical protein
MSGVTKNLVVILGLATLAFAGYYVYQQQFVTILLTGDQDETLNQIKAETDIFIGRRQLLDQVVITDELFSDERFRSLRAFTTPPENMPIGRNNPFDSVGQPTIVNEEVE